MFTLKSGNEICFSVYLGAVCPTATQVQNAQRTIVSGDLTSYASIIRYDCNDGYELVGEPILFCQSDNQWSANLPSCISKYVLINQAINQDVFVFSTYF